MTHNKQVFKELKITQTSKFRIGNGHYIAVKGKGTIAIESSLGTKLIYDVLYVPEMDQNLLSVGQLMEKGSKIYFENKYCLIKNASGQVLQLNHDKTTN